MNIKIKHQIFWDTAKMVMIGKKSKSQFRNLTFHHKNLEKEQITSKKDQKKEINRIIKQRAGSLKRVI